MSRQAIDDAIRNNHAATCVALAERWLVDHPDDLGIVYKYAEMLYFMARYDDAIQVFEDTLVRFPKARWLVLNALGNLHRYRGDFGNAELAYQKAIDEHPEDAVSYIFLGAIQARKGDLVAAEATHRKAISCPKGDINEAYHNLGLVLRGQGRFAEAKECFAKAIELCPDYEEALVAHADVTHALNILGQSSTPPEVT